MSTIDFEAEASEFLETNFDKYDEETCARLSTRMKTLANMAARAAAPLRTLSDEEIFAIAESRPRGWYENDLLSYAHAILSAAWQAPEGWERVKIPFVRATVGRDESLVVGRFRSKPVEVDAFPVRDALLFAVRDLGSLPDWLRNAYDSGGIIFELGRVSINTLEGAMVGNIDDWIVRGLKGELYPVKPDIFELRWEPVTVQGRTEVSQ